ncbi:PREDICTED: uncharacterized protein KIAA0947 homolog [Chrysochloris asiatica]|uniref:Uncharacterized protein KIAA0947 homolog n=1 Tax=Chrysochloris asiatica TaxID=185453 RepID=A0A9B0X043_CHRAS|nr:PREDICTED: uncharacterized protein KIAA0947 homolog [Chrysochloris asiatica]
MMPGETRSAAPMPAAELSRCQGCASLQQNLNEYVDALITLKQKIINTDNLLTEYQKKCDELQFARRENSTLHHQVEQMLQKISPLQQCQEELGTLKAELEEKKSSLKLYQETHQEYARVKEECLKSDAQKKKLEAKVKKLEEAAFKQIQDFKQLRNEKKVLEKEYKKTQERLDEFSKQKNEKELKHIGTQISSESYSSIDKRKVKLLLKELWLCINTTHGLPGAGRDHSPAVSVQERSRTPEGQTVEPCTPDTPPRRAGVLSSCKRVGKERPRRAGSRGKLRYAESFLCDQETTDFSDHDPPFDEDLQAAIDFFKLPPPLLSPVPSPPPPPASLPHPEPDPSPLAPESCFGEDTDSSEDDGVQRHHTAGSAAEDDAAASQSYFGSFIRNKSSGTLFQQPHEVLQAPRMALPATPSPCFWSSEQPQGLSSPFQNVPNREATEVREVDKCVQTEEPAPRPVGRPACSSSPLSTRPLLDLFECGGRSLFSKILGSPPAGFTRRALAEELAFESDRVRAISELFHRVSRELERGRRGRRGFTSEEESLDTGLSPSSTSGALSLGSGPQSSSDDDARAPSRRRAFFRVPHGQPSPALVAAPSRGSLSSTMAPRCSVLGDQVESSSHSLSPVLGVPTFSAQCADVVRGGSSFPQSVFMNVTKDGPCESQELGSRLLPAPQAGWVPGSFGVAQSASWHRDEFLRTNGEGRLRAEPEQAQETGRHLHKAAPSPETRESATRLNLPTEPSSPVLARAASVLPNQVSVITKQAKADKMPTAAPGPLQLHRSEAPLATDHLRTGADRGGDGGHAAPTVAAAAARTSPGGSTPQGAFGSDSSGSVSPGEHSPCSTNSGLSFSSGSIPVQLQHGHEELGKQRPPLPPVDPGALRMDVDQLPATPAPRMVPRALSAEDVPCGDSGRSQNEALAVARGSPHTPQTCDELEKPKSRTPSSAFADGFASTGTASPSALFRKNNELPALTHSQLPDAPYGYTGRREGPGDDTEVEESEAFTGSEAESEGGPMEGGGPTPDLADTGAAETWPGLEVGHLTSALQDVNISAFSEIDTLSTSEVVSFLESCQLRDFSSGDSVSECSSKGAPPTEVSQGLKESQGSGEQYRKQPGEEEAADASQESEVPEEVFPLGNTSPLPECALETLSEVLTNMDPELRAHFEDSTASDAGDLLLLDSPDTVAAEHFQEQALPQEAAHSSPRADPGTGSAASGHESLHSAPEAATDTAGQAAGGEEEPEQNAHGFPHRAPTAPSETIDMLLPKDHNLMIRSGDKWTIMNGVALVSSVDHVLLPDSPGDTGMAPAQKGLEAGSVAVTSVDKSPEMALMTGPAMLRPQGNRHPSGSREDASSSSPSANFDKSRLRNRPVRPSVRISSQIYSQDFEVLVASDHTYYNSRLEPCGKSKNRSKLPNKEPSARPAKASAPSTVDSGQSEASQLSSGERGTSDTQRSQTQAVLASADTSTPPEGPTDTLNKIRQEVGPPLPPLLAPLIATPPRTLRPVSPLMSTCSPCSPASPLGPSSPLDDAPVSPMTSPLQEGAGLASPPCTSLSPSTAPGSERALASPLQFCAATPKHALPVPGRLPPGAPGPAAAGGAQENSVKILDTMYPELSARARTLNILKGNIQLSRGQPADCTSLPGPVGAIAKFKAITSTSTAFVKTGASAGGDSSQEKSRDSEAPREPSGKRTLSTTTLRSAKRLRLDSGSPESETREARTEGTSRNLRKNVRQSEVVPANGERNSSFPAVGTVPQLPLNPKETLESQDKAIANALKKIGESSFDLLPVIRSHVYVGNISKKPVMRDQEKEVVYEFSTTKKHLAECLLHSILAELSAQKTSSEHSYLHALCRVYVGVCRQLGDLERARLFCYSILKEDFPESDKLTLFIANMWHDIFISQSVINKAMQLVARQRAKGEVLNCLRAFLNWEKNAPVDVGFMVSKLLLTIQLCPKTEFQPSEKFGEDLSDNAWECIFAIDLLCCHQRWIWTHDNIISKELWPVMDKWIKYRKGHPNVTHTPDIIVASVLRLIGRLGQLGLKEGFPSAVKNISSVIGMFIQHAQDEDIPWGIQLAAAYALCDLSPSNPEETSRILEGWRKAAPQSVPAAVISYLEEAGALCTQEQG